jgi:16S rRNA (cytosine1402-N4)-methyltransferase
MSKAFDFVHQPVLVAEIISLLNIKPDGCYVDCTLGGGGHAAAILDRLDAGGLLIGIDQDSDALAAAEKRLGQIGSPAGITLQKGNFADLDAILDRLGRPAVDGILADLGVSSWQLDNPLRGFGYGQDGPLDMRMDRDGSLTAEQIVNNWPAESISRILSDFGEERYARAISRAIVARRKAQPFRTTADLAGVIAAAMPSASRRENQHPARRSFQALRMAVNDELGVLARLLETAPDRLAEGGRFCVITFHSLEDRLVKQTFRTLEKPCICPRDFPVCTCGRVPAGRVLTRRPVSATARELSDNPRSRSANLRCFERIIDRQGPNTARTEHDHV